MEVRKRRLRRAMETWFKVGEALATSRRAQTAERDLTQTVQDSGSVQGQVMSAPAGRDGIETIRNATWEQGESRRNNETTREQDDDTTEQGDARRHHGHMTKRDEAIAKRSGRADDGGAGGCEPPSLDVDSWHPAIAGLAEGAGRRELGVGG